MSVTTKKFWAVVPASKHANETAPLPGFVTTTRYSSEAAATEAASIWASETGRVLYVAEAKKRVSKLPPVPPVEVTELT